MWRYVWLSAMIICMGMLLGDRQDLETSMLRNNMYIYICLTKYTHI